MNEHEQAELVYDTLCDWCGTRGAMQRDMEPIETSSGPKRRCIDRNMCRITKEMKVVTK